MVGGLGITLIIVAVTAGAINGEIANSSLISLAVISGFGLLILAIGGWFSAVQPHKNFDDINIPLEAEPHHDH